MHKYGGDYMDSLYKNITDLCDQAGISGYRLCKEAGVQPSILTDLKMGRQKGLSAKNAEKIASYFGISVGQLIGNTPVPDFRGAFHNTSNSNVVVGNTGENINMSFAEPPQEKLTEQETEVLRIFRSLDMRKKTSVLSYLYELEDGGKEG